MLQCSMIAPPLPLIAVPLCIEELFNLNSTSSIRMLPPESMAVLLLKRQLDTVMHYYYRLL